MRGRAASPGREPWPWIVAGLLAAMMSASVAFYRIAAAHPDPVVVENTWRAGRAYSERVRAARRAEALGWDVALRTEPVEGGVRVTVTLPPGGGTGAGRAAPASLSVLRVRPAEGGLDRRFGLTPDPGGATWTGEVPLPRVGRWHLVVRAEGEHGALERRFRVWRAAPVRASGRGAVEGDGHAAIPPGSDRASRPSAARPGGGR